MHSNIQLFHSRTLVTCIQKSSFPGYSLLVMTILELVLIHLYVLAAYDVRLGG